MKIFKRCLVALLTIVILYLSASFSIRAYVSKNSEISFMGEKYTRLDRWKNNFMPFGSDYGDFEDETGFINILGVSFSKTDKERNFLYHRDFIETKVYKKDSYEMPEYPNADDVDELIVSIDSKENKITINDKESIAEIVNCIAKLELTNANLSETDKNEDCVQFFAVSKNIGGIYRLNDEHTICSDGGRLKYGHLIVSELPEEIQIIMNFYLI